MRFRPCTVSVTQLPESVDMRRGRLFFKELECQMNIDRPCIVLDCSRVHDIDRFVIHMLLCCLEEAMKRDGDVKLAAVSPSARKVLEMTGVEQLFEIYDSETEAVNSFFRPHFERPLYGSGDGGSDELSESAA